MYLAKIKLLKSLKNSVKNWVKKRSFDSLMIQLNLLIMLTKQFLFVYLVKSKMRLKI